MKRIVLILFASGAFLLMATTVANAQQKETTAEKTVQVNRTGFVDSNGDGVCDNYDGVRPGKGQGPGNGLGEGRATGQGKGQRQGLRDGSGQGQRRFDGTGTRRGMRSGLRDGSGPNCAPQKTSK